MNAMVAAKPKLEIFWAECSNAQVQIDLVRRLAESQFEVFLCDVCDPAIAKRASDLGIQTIPAVVLDAQVLYTIHTSCVDFAGCCLRLPNTH